MSKVIDGLGVLFRILLAVFLFVLIQLTVLLGFKAAGLDTKIYNGLFSTVYGTIMIGAFLLFAYVLSFKRDKLLMTAKPNYMQVFSAIVIAFGLLGLVNIYIYAATVISQYFVPLQEDLAQYNENVDRFATIEASTVPYWDTILDFIASFMIIPFTEELVFRGVIFGELKNKIHPVLAAVISSLIFGILHGVSVHIGYAFICGIVLSLVYYYTGSIWVSYIVHALFNLIGSSVFALVDSGIFGDLTDISNFSAFFLAVFEIICILPGIAGFLLIMAIYKEKNKKDEVISVPEAEAAV